MSVPSPETPRYEIKFVASARDLHEVLRCVRVNRAGFREPYPPRQVNNVYFDTFDQFAYSENLSGASARSKVRFRWYGSVDRPESGTLEVKCRRGGVGWKISHRVGAVPLAGSSWREMRSSLREQLSADGRIWLDSNPQAILINRYQRRYFLSADALVRLTVDWEQRVYDQRLRTVPNFTRAANLPDTVVVELKFGREDHGRANRFIQEIPLRLSRNSKYVIGTSSIVNG